MCNIDYRNQFVPQCPCLIHKLRQTCWNDAIKLMMLKIGCITTTDNWRFPNMLMIQITCDCKVVMSGFVFQTFTELSVISVKNPQTCLMCSVGSTSFSSWSLRTASVCIHHLMEISRKKSCSQNLHSWNKATCKCICNENENCFMDLTKTEHIFLPTPQKSP